MTARARLFAFLARQWHGLNPPLTAVLVGGLLLPLLAIGLLSGIELVLVLLSEQLRTVALVGLVWRLLVAVVLAVSLVGVVRTFAGRGRRHAMLTLFVLVGGVAILGLLRGPPVAAAVREEIALAAGRDPMGPPAVMRIEQGELLIEGVLAQGSADRLQALLAGGKGLTIVALDSAGGRMLEAQRMAAMIRAAGLDTMVVGDCQSACTQLLLAGRERCALAGTAVGFHQGTADGNDRLDDALLAIEQKATMLAAGVEETFADRAVAVPSGDMWLPSERELLAAGVLTHAHEGKDER